MSLNFHIKQNNDRSNNTPVERLKRCKKEKPIQEKEENEPDGEKGGWVYVGAGGGGVRDNTGEEITAVKK